AINAAGASTASPVVTATTFLAPATGFAAAAASATQVNLSWTAVVHATGYKIERSPNNTTWTALAPVPALTGSSNSYQDKTVAAGTTYYYRIYSINALGTSVASSAVNTLTQPA